MFWLVLYLAQEIGDGLSSLFDDEGLVCEWHLNFFFKRQLFPYYLSSGLLDGDGPRQPYRSVGDAREVPLCSLNQVLAPVTVLQVPEAKLVAHAPNEKLVALHYIFLF